MMMSVKMMEQALGAHIPLQPQAPKKLSPIAGASGAGIGLQASAGSEAPASGDKASAAPPAGVHFS